MLRIKVTLLALAILFSVPGMAQIDQKQIEIYCNNDQEKCGPYDMLPMVTKVLGAETEKAPYRQILHIETKRSILFFSAKTDYGTVSFIDSNTLITARHVVSGSVSKISLSVPNQKNDKWIELSKKDFAIKFYSSSVDIAVVEILNHKIAKELYRGSSFTSGVLDASSMMESEANLTGYPCYFANNPAQYDTLINKSAKVKLLKFSKNHIGYRVFTCIGDSGAPLWVNVGGKYVVVGIHHGGNDAEKDFPEGYNLAVRFNDKMVEWLNSFVK